MPAGNSRKSESGVTAVVLAAGKGTRMRSGLIKVLHPLLGTPVLGHILALLSQLGIQDPVIVTGSHSAAVRQFARKAGAQLGMKPVCVRQARQLGTGHAVMCAKSSLGTRSGNVIVLPGDMPLLRPETLRELIRAHRSGRNHLSVLSSLQIDPAGYGRILRAGGSFTGIREESDANEAEKRIQEVNSGVLVFDKASLLAVLGKIRASNAKSEYYLTDAVEIMSKAGKQCAAFPLAAPEEGLGINSRKDLAQAGKVMMTREIKRHMENGVTFEMPEQTVVAAGVRIGADTVIRPWTYIEKDVVIGKNCEIGPFAKIRSGSRLGDGAVVGSFVEINRSSLGRKTMAKHLAYLGDARIGDDVNIGAGTITANFDGRKKHQTRIGRKALIGSNTVLVAPAEIGAGARTGAGAVVTGGTRVSRGETVAGVPARKLKVKKNKKRK